MHFFVIFPALTTTQHIKSAKIVIKITEVTAQIQNPLKPKQANEIPNYGGKALPQKIWQPTGVKCDDFLKSLRLSGGGQYQQVVYLLRTSEQWRFSDFAKRQTGDYFQLGSSKYRRNKEIFCQFPRMPRNVTRDNFGSIPECSLLVQVGIRCCPIGSWWFSMFRNVGGVRCGDLNLNLVERKVSN